MKPFYLILILFQFLSACSASKSNKPSPQLEARAKAEQNAILQADGTSSGASASTVAIYDTNSTELCSGVIIGPNAILTAAHCVAEDFSSTIVIFGQKIRKGESTARKVKAVFIPEDRALVRFQEINTSDIAIVIFQGMLPQTHKPAILANTERQFLNSDSLSLAGFGLTNGSTLSGAGTLLETAVKIDGRLGKNEFLINQSNGKGACQGDSGGPGYALNNGQKIVWGIVSRGHNDDIGNCTGYSVITNIIPYKNWIQQKMDLQ